MGIMGSAPSFASRPAPQGSDQSIVLNGISGSGKTVTAKQCVELLGRCCRLQRGTPQQMAVSAAVDAKVQAAFTVLEVGHNCVPVSACLLFGA